MNDARTAFLDSATRATGFLARPEVARSWADPSVLADFSVSGLAGHLLRGIKTVETYLDGPEPVGEGLTAAGYYHAVGLTPDVAAPLNREVRARGEEAAVEGYEAVVLEAQGVTQRLVERVPIESGERKIRVFGDRVMTLDEYLRTRVVELVLHTDDLALSVGLPHEGTLPSPAASVAIDTLVDLARLRHGDVAVLWALARRERDMVDALRVL